MESERARERRENVGTDTSMIPFVCGQGTPKRQTGLPNAIALSCDVCWYSMID
jgi:hypothetical protein